MFRADVYILNKLAVPRGMTKVDIWTTYNAYLLCFVRLIHRIYWNITVTRDLHVLT
jgi:hypothetical protein